MAAQAHRDIPTWRMSTTWVPCRTKHQLRRVLADPGLASAHAAHHSTGYLQRVEQTIHSLVYPTFGEDPAQQIDLDPGAAPTP
jgi:hypothetical protein